MLYCMLKFIGTGIAVIEPVERKHPCLGLGEF